MNSFVRKWLPPAVAVFLGITLLYLALRGVEFGALWDDLQNGNYLWLIPFVAVTLIAHIIRAWRWRLLLEALPENDGATRIPLRLVFASVMIGFMANYSAPRLGEIIRSSHISMRRKLRFGSVFGTVVADRVLDMIALGIFLLSLPLVLGSRLSSLFELLGDAFQSISSPSIIVAVVAVVLVASFGLYLFVRSQNENDKGQTFIEKIAFAFKDGLISLANSNRKTSILVSTMFMWVCYLLMTYIPLEIFGLVGDGGLSMIYAWALLLIGALGIVVPSPGGVGSYHFLAIQSLVILWSISQEAAASYAIFAHAAQMILYTAVGFMFVLAEGATWKQLSQVPNEEEIDASSE